MQIGIIMKVEKHNEEISTIFFDNDEEMENFKDKLKEQGFVKFESNNI